MDNKKVGNAIAFLRKRAGFTQKDIAERIGISDKAVSKWERGLAMPDISCLVKLAILLDTDADSLLAGDVAYHDERWRGVLVLEPSTSGVNAATMIYDKPLVYFLLSHFILVGIRQILVVGSAGEIEFMKQEFGGGEDLGIQLVYSDAGIHRALEENSTFTDPCNTMVLFGRSIIYGVGQSRFFCKAMENCKQITILALPKKSKDPSRQLYFDEQKKVTSANCKQRIITQYDYCCVPVLFFPAGTISGALEGVADFQTAVARLVRDGRLYTEVLDRGFFEKAVDDWTDAADAANYVRLVQEESGSSIYCIEEIAWRRGLISREKLREVGRKKANTQYGAYLLELSQKE